MQAMQPSKFVLYTNRSCTSSYRSENIPVFGIDISLTCLHPNILPWSLWKQLSLFIEFLSQFLFPSLSLGVVLKFALTGPKHVSDFPLVPTTWGCWRVIWDGELVTISFYFYSISGTATGTAAVVTLWLVKFLEKVLYINTCIHKDF